MPQAGRLDCGGCDGAVNQCEPAAPLGARSRASRADGAVDTEGSIRARRELCRGADQAPVHEGAAIQIEVRRGATTVIVQWPSSAMHECALWLRELLK